MLQISFQNDEQCRESWLKSHEFTDSTRLLFQQVRQRASARGAFGVIPQHLVLWAMLRWETRLPQPMALEWKLGAMPSSTQRRQTGS